MAQPGIGVHLAYHVARLAIAHLLRQPERFRFAIPGTHGFRDLRQSRFVGIQVVVVITESPRGSAAMSRR